MPTSLIQSLPPLTLLLAEPRGFCAGVDRAVQIVEKTLMKYGAPVYVRHEIVHNQHVVKALEDKGAIFVNEIDEIPQDRPVIFSAHGVPKSVPQNAKARNLFYIDATCPLVSKVHREAERHGRLNHHIILIGHEGHPEVIGTMGQVEKGRMTLVTSKKDVERLTFPANAKIAYVTQTTLSVDETKQIINRLTERFPNISGPQKEDICYATTNRQMAVKAIANKAQVLFVMGAPNSSNSRRLVDVAKASGCPRSFLIQSVNDIDWQDLKGISILGMTASASAPEVLVQEVIEACNKHFNVTLKPIVTAKEEILFKLPIILTKV